mmetsp:Transcript_31668/g.98652  ORF Transcript_31668/g.98652 Transcript_31668/m.98652 type:complete len:217 (-) Transcript_31668:691-1341(-)
MAFRWCRCSSVERMLLMEPGTALELLDVAGLLRQASRRMSCTLTDLLEKVGELLSPSSRPPRSRLSVATSMAMSEVSASSCSRRTSAFFSSLVCAAALASMATFSSSACLKTDLVSALRCRRTMSSMRMLCACAATSAPAALQTPSSSAMRSELSARRSLSATSSSRNACRSLLPGPLAQLLACRLSRNSLKALHSCSRQASRLASADRSSWDSWP